MTEKPTAHSAQPESPPHRPEHNPPPAVSNAHSAWAARVTANSPPGARPTRSRWKTRPARVLVALGIALAVLGYLLYPRADGQLPTPLSPYLTIATKFPISLIAYRVTQVSPSTTEMTIKAESRPVSQSSTLSLARLAVSLPYGVHGHEKVGAHSYDCHPPACTTINGAETWTKLLSFGTTGSARATFFLSATDFGAISNGAAASAALPGVTYDGPNTPVLLAIYNIPSASQFNWIGYKTYQTTSTLAVWKEQLANGPTSEKTTSGTNPIAQAANALGLFLAGILFGSAGGALVAAVQEALHARAARRG
jgi:hypothetical protein